MKTKARELKTRMTLMGVQVRDTVCRKGIVKTAKDGLARFAREEDGMGTVEIILIIVDIYTNRFNVNTVFSVPCLYL